MMKKSSDIKLRWTRTFIWGHRSQEAQISDRKEDELNIYLEKKKKKTVFLILPRKIKAEKSI